MFYLLVKVSFAFLLPESLESLCVMFYLKDNNSVQCYSVLSDFHPMNKDDNVT